MKKDFTKSQSIKSEPDYKDLYIKELKAKVKFLEDIVIEYVQTIPLKERVEMEHKYLNEVYNSTGEISEFGSFFYPDIYKKEKQNTENLFNV